MKISQLIRLKSKLQSFDFNQSLVGLDTLDGQVSQAAKLEMSLDYNSKLCNVLQSIDTVESMLNSNVDYVKTIISDIDIEIINKAAQFNRLGYKINGYYGSDLTNFDVERNERTLEITDSERSIIINVLRGYTDWKFPVLEVGPGDGAWTESLVAGDPLYIIDRHKEFLDSTLSRFNSFYRRRIRPYLTGIHASREEFDFSMLPKYQFGFIFAWNVINFWPYEETKYSLKQFYDLLRPGGSMMFSFNNCDVWQCAESAETGFKSFLTTEMLNKLFSEIGFEVIKFTTLSTHVHYVEIKKPGILSTIKRHQTLGKIIEIKSQLLDKSK